MLQYLPILFTSEFVCPGLIELSISCTNISCIFPILFCIIALGYFSRISLDNELLKGAITLKPPVIFHINQV